VTRYAPVLLAGVLTLTTGLGNGEEPQDLLHHRWYRVELVLFEQDPALAARESFSPDGIVVRERLLETVIYPGSAFPLAEDPVGDTDYPFGPPPPVQDQPPFVVSNLVPPSWFAGTCVTQAWVPSSAELFEMRSAVVRDPCLPPDPWTVESAGIEMAMSPEMPEPATDDTRAEESEAEEVVEEPSVTLEEVQAAFRDFEDELLRTSYTWRRQTPEFARQRSDLRRRYHVIAAGSWHQPLPPREQPQPLLVQVGHMDAGRRYPLEGLVSVTLGRYIHFRATLLYRLGSEGLALFQEQRRMRSEEPHYLDHPALGILVRVDPIDIPADLADAANMLDSDP